MKGLVGPRESVSKRPWRQFSSVLEPQASSNRKPVIVEEAPRTMRKLARWIPLLLVLMTPLRAAAYGKIRGHILPLDAELLAVPVELTNHCDSVAVVEWKATRGDEKSTADSPLSRETMNNACEVAYSKFAAFVRMKGYKFSGQVKLRAEISLLPADLTRSGTEYRNLNDINFRFTYRTTNYDETGLAIPIWGYYARALKHIFVRNDILDAGGTAKNRDFVAHFSHELFHALSYQNGIFSQYTMDPGQTDEVLAAEFVRYLGY